MRIEGGRHISIYCRTMQFLKGEYSNMTNKEKYIQAFCEAFEITPEQTEGLVYTGIPEWDSVGHMNLISAIEDTFDIMMDTDDIIEFSSFEKGMEILQEKYDVEF